MEEERHQRARRMARENTREREDRIRQRTENLKRELDRVGPDRAQEIVTRAEREKHAEYIGSEKTPGDWAEACRIARDTVIAAARNGKTITYGEIKLAVYRVLGKLVGYSQFANLVMSINQKNDGALLSAIVVTKDTGTPGDGFLPYAREQGYDAPLATLQRQVWEAFRG